MKFVGQSNRLRVMAAASTLAAGWVFYLSARGFDPLRLIGPPMTVVTGDEGVSSLIWNSMPTLLHAAAFLFLFRIVCSSRRSLWGLWLVSTFGYELLQGLFPVFGTFDFFDMLSIAMVAPFVYLAARTQTDSPVAACRTRVLTAAFAGLTSVATSGPPGSPRITHTVVCMQVSELRSGFAVEAPRALVQSGRIFLNGNMLLISEPFQGVHVFDNTDPAAPVAVAFLKIPGNTDIAMKDSYLYADSAVDLLTIRFDGNSATLVGRAENVLVPRTPAEFSDEDFYVPEEQLSSCEKTGGVVVGYERREDGATYKRKIEENKND